MQNDFIAKIESRKIDRNVIILNWYPTQKLFKEKFSKVPILTKCFGEKLKILNPSEGFGNVNKNKKNCSRVNV